MKKNNRKPTRTIVVSTIVILAMVTACILSLKAVSRSQAEAANARSASITGQAGAESTASSKLLSRMTADEVRYIPEYQSDDWSEVSVTDWQEEPAARVSDYSDLIEEETAAVETPLINAGDIVVVDNVIGSSAPTEKSVMAAEPATAQEPVQSEPVQEETVKEPVPQAAAKLVVNDNVIAAADLKETVQIQSDSEAVSEKSVPSDTEVKEQPEPEPEVTEEPAQEQEPIPEESAAQAIEPVDSRVVETEEEPAPEPAEEPEPISEPESIAETEPVAEPEPEPEDPATQTIEPVDSHIAEAEEEPAPEPVEEPESIEKPEEQPAGEDPAQIQDDPENFESSYIFDEENDPEDDRKAVLDDPQDAPDEPEDDPQNTPDEPEDDQKDTPDEQQADDSEDTPDEQEDVTPVLDIEGSEEPASAVEEPEDDQEDEKPADVPVRRDRNGRAPDTEDNTLSAESGSDSEQGSELEQGSDSEPESKPEPEPELEPEPEPEPKYEPLPYDASIGQAVVNMAYSLVGVTPYVWAGNSLEEGTDCSGFVHLIYESFGIYVPRGSDLYQEWANISYEDLMPGDIVVYRYGGHVAIYVGNDTIVHCSNEEDGTKISDMWYDNPTGYVRAAY